MSFFDANNVHNGYELQKVFGIDIPKCSTEISLRYQVRDGLIYRLLRKIGMYYAGYKYTVRDIAEGFDPRFLKHFKSDDYLFGFWQSEKYFNGHRKQILKAFTFPMYIEVDNIRVSAEMRENNSIAMHVRRGDYVHNKMFVNLADIGYYDCAISKIIEVAPKERKWYIFSDDIGWCKENLPLQNECVEYVNWNTKGNSFRDMQLMTECNYVIVANSSFSWWGAYLNQYAKVIIAPKQYYVNNDGFNKDICPDSWIKV
ncbi:alpha-1,2-fucosyltransferase [Robinsoniella sp. KNHs210]|uniref:alpha-1,2-fucosyltransferase n=1 Tax=Robinsoniella sp. KNHs210 TaxID=1469950 RepID=UPI00048904BA|nr:alpha-1,2-fucosyltransferase [Robinsoniella sp. KNHs210]